MTNFSFSDLGGSPAIRIAVVAALSILSLFLLVITLNALQDFGRSNIPYTNTITVEGTGKANAVPNIATIMFTVEQSAATVAAAQEAATKKANTALEFVKKQDVDDKDVQASGYNVYPKYEYTPCGPGTVCTQTSRITGYTVSETVTVKVRNTDKAGVILQGLGSLEVSNISGPNFTVDDPSATQAEARGKAIADAKEKAKVLAGQLGVSLGKVVNFNENGGAYPYYTSYAKGGVAMDMAVAQSAPPVLPTGQNETNVSVTITYEIR